MSRSRCRSSIARSLAVLAAACLSLFVAGDARSATIVYIGGATGGGTQSYLPTNSISGTMLASVPRFNGLLGTLLQADFEWVGTIGGTWTSTGAPFGTSTFSISGPSDVGGQAMGILAVGYSAPFNDLTPSIDYAQSFTSATFTSGAFFNSLTGAGNELMTWTYSGSNSVDTPAIGAFDWAGSVHTLYTYEPVPEPGTLALTWVVVGVLAAAKARARRARRDGV